MTITTAIEEYLRYLDTVARRAPATMQAYRADLRKFAAFLGDATPVELTDIQPPTVEHWMASMRHLSDATVRRSLNALSSLFRWAMRFGYATSNPLDVLERPKKKRRIEPCPTPNELAAMLGASRGHAERAALLALATSGLRRAELLSLTWHDVDLHHRRMRIRGKGDKDREVLIFDELLAELYAMRTEQGFDDLAPVLRGRRGRALQVSTLQRWLKSWLKRSGVTTAYTLHSLRRFAAKSWLDNGLNIHQVQILLGHESLETTILYLNYSLDEIQRSAVAVDFHLRSSPAAH